jgi:hypothetical protein
MMRCSGKSCLTGRFTRSAARKMSRQRRSIAETAIVA